ncbi:MAG: hypothetical protein NZ578_04835 [Candidatus Binatia bacterium]|nr:hypothetical protein [Candidatus Binatia bacterium]
MSTILDALRKVEGEQRARTTDARARLLLTPLPPLPRHTRLRFPRSWLVNIGLACGGFAVGLGVVLWRSPLYMAQEQVTHAPVSSPTSASQTPTTAGSPLSVPPPPEETANPPSVASSSPPLPDGVYEFSPDEEFAAVQRSPFVSTPPAREATTAPQPPLPFLSAVQREQQPVFVTGADLPGAGRGETASVVPPEHQTPREAARLSPTSPDSLSRTPAAGQAGASAVEPGAVPTNTSVSFLQWSPDPSKRIAFIKLNNGPLTLVQEGDTVNGFTVVEIRRNEVELRSGTSRITLHAK